MKRETKVVAIEINHKGQELTFCPKDLEKYKAALVDYFSKKLQVTTN